MTGQTDWYDDVRFDRLVDGELSPDEYRALLAALDDEPGGWRRCALAFLEAQAMARELGAIRTSGQLMEAHNVAAGPASALASGWKLLLAMAASFLIAFALGVMRRRWFHFGDVPELAGGALSDRAAYPASSGPVAPRPIGNARLVLDGPEGRTDAAEVPIYEVSGNASQWLGAQEPALPAELIAELERRGHKVERQQQYVPVDWNDGRQGVVPVEGYRITPARYTY